MSVLSTIRQKLGRKEQEQRDAEIREYNELVVAVADGHEPDPETVERLLTGGTAERQRLVCPTNAQHERLRVRSAEGNVRRCICDDCGTEFQQEIDPAAANVEGRTLQDLEADVEKLRQRRAWKAQLDRLPELDEAETALKGKQEKAREKVRKAQAEQQKVAEETGPELRSLEIEKRDAHRAREQLVASCRDPRIVEQYEALEQRRREVGLRRRDLKLDLWGYGPVGELRDTVRGSTGDKVLGKQRTIDKIAGDKRHPQRHKLPELQSRLARFKAREYEPKVREFHALGGELEQVEAQLAELRETMLEP